MIQINSGTLGLSEKECLFVYILNMYLQKKYYFSPEAGTVPYSNSKGPLCLWVPHCLRTRPGPGFVLKCIFPGLQKKGTVPTHKLGLSILTTRPIVQLNKIFTLSDSYFVKIYRSHHLLHIITLSISQDKSYYVVICLLIGSNVKLSYWFFMYTTRTISGDIFRKWVLIAGGATQILFDVSCLCQS